MGMDHSSGGEREGENQVDTNEPHIRAIELTQRTTPAGRRTDHDSLTMPTGCVRLICQAAHVGYRLYARPEHHQDDHLL